MLNIRSGVKNKILSYFFLNETSRVYINELARLIGSDPKNVYRILLQLEEDGILESEFKGKERYFFPQPKNPFYKGYKEIFLKTAGLENLLTEQLKGIGGLEKAYIFGSYATGEFNAKSDVDLLLIGSHNSLEAQRILYRLQKGIGREISVVNMKPDEFKKRSDEKDQFIESIFSRRVVKLL
jgi:predicted nucleotidyltransferase